MATLLSASLEKMISSTDAPPRQTTSKSKTSSRATPKRRVARMKLSQPPNAETCFRFQFYGYDVTVDWLVEFARCRVENPTEWANTTLLKTAVQLLQQESGFTELTMEMGSLDEEAPPSVKTYDSWVPLLSVCSTGDRSTYYRRPTQAQIDRLTTLLEREPRWWTDFRSLESYM